MGQYKGTVKWFNNVKGYASLGTMAAMMYSSISAQFKKMVTKVSKEAKRSSSTSFRGTEVLKLTASFGKRSQRPQRISNQSSKTSPPAKFSKTAVVANV